MVAGLDLLNIVPALWWQCSIVVPCFWWVVQTASRQRVDKPRREVRSFRHRRRADTDTTWHRLRRKVVLLRGAHGAEPTANHVACEGRARRRSSGLRFAKNNATGSSSLAVRAGPPTGAAERFVSLPCRWNRSKNCWDSLVVCEGRP